MLIAPGARCRQLFFAARANRDLGNPRLGTPRDPDSVV